MGAQHKGALLTHVERKSLFTPISKLPRPTAKAAHHATVYRLTPFRNHVHTITYDNGKEFAGHRKTAALLRAQIFFATPYSCVDKIPATITTSWILRNHPYCRQVEVLLNPGLKRGLLPEVLSIDVEMESGGDLLPDDVIALNSIHTLRRGIHVLQLLLRVQSPECLRGDLAYFSE